MGKDLVPVGQVYEAEASETPYVAHVDAICDEYVDVLPVGDEHVSTPLDEADEEALEMGIASVFDELRAEAEEPTLALLAELNRIWAEPLAA